MRRHRAAAAVVATGSALAALGTLNAMRNLGIVRRAPAPSESARAQIGTWNPRVSVLMPARNEATRLPAALTALASQEYHELIVLDDASSDGTADVARQILAPHPRAKVLVGTSEPPPGWLGKPWACQRLGEAATGDLLLFVDADVVVDDAAVRRIAALMAQSGADLLCPYPRQNVSGVLGRLVQPLLQWSWLTTLPLDLAERSPRPATAAGNGQLLAVRRDTYCRIGGHAAVRAQVLEDVALVREVKSVGGRAGMADGTDLASCRMYDSDRDLIDGYTKSLWSAFGSPVGAVAVTGSLALAYVVPPAAALFGRRRSTRVVGAVGYAAAVAGRWAVARRTGQRVWPDVLVHPLSIVAFAALTGESFRRRRAGELSWRGRPVTLRSDGPPDRSAAVVP